MMAGDFRPDYKSGPPPPDAEMSALLATLRAAPDVVLFRHKGNIGDELILAGTRRLLSGIAHRETGVWEMGEARGHTALIIGSGGWCVPFHHQLPQALPEIEARFERVFILPSTFDLAEPSLRALLAKTKAKVFARERESFAQVREICDAALSHDHAFYFDYRSYFLEGQGALSAFREDKSSAFGAVPAGNLDISDKCFGLDHFLWTIARHKSVATDRAHVMIAAACLGKTVRYRPNSDHKVAGIANYSLAAFGNVARLG